jgi:hypothetical protein
MDAAASHAWSCAAFGAFNMISGTAVDLMAAFGDETLKYHVAVPEILMSSCPVLEHALSLAQPAGGVINFYGGSH